MKKFKLVISALAALVLVLTAGLTACGTNPSSDTTGAYISGELTDGDTSAPGTTADTTGADTTTPAGTLDDLTAEQLLNYASQAAMAYTSYKQNTTMDITLSILGEEIKVGVTTLKVKSGENASLSVTTGDSGEAVSRLITYAGGACFMASDSGKFIQKNADEGTFTVLENAADNTLLSNFRYDMFKDAAVIKTDSGYAVTGSELDAALAAEFAAEFEAEFGETGGDSSVSITSGSVRYEFDILGNLLGVTLRLELAQDMAGMMFPYVLSVQLDVSDINADFAIGAPEDADSYVEVSSLSDLIAFIDAVSDYSMLMYAPCEFSRVFSYSVSTGEKTETYAESDSVASSADSDSYEYSGSSTHSVDADGEKTDYRIYYSGDTVRFAGGYSDDSMTVDDVYSFYSDILNSAMLFDSTLITSFASEAVEDGRECSFSLDAQTAFDCMAIYMQLHSGITIDEDYTYEVAAFIGSLALSADGVITGASWTLEGSVTTGDVTYAVSINCAVSVISVGTATVTPIE